MAEEKIILTDRGIANLSLSSSGQYIVRDAELAGFFIMVGKQKKTFMVQADLRTKTGRRSLRVKIGVAGEMTARKARAVAMEVLGTIARGKDPRDGQEKAAPKPIEPTLREAWQRYRDAHMERKGRSTGTIENYRDHVERLMAKWQDMSLSELGNNPRIVIERHEAISEANGPYIANGCMRTLRAIYNHARKSCRTLPAENPVNALDWNAERRRDTAMGLKDLAAWFANLSMIKHPLRREFHLLLLLSGSRPDALKSTRPEHVDFRRRALHIPRPKGGEHKAFDIPLSRPMCRCLLRAFRIGRMLYPAQCREWVFPADSESGHLVEHKEDRALLPKWGNDLRQTYRTIGQIAGIADLDMHLLMNHSVPGVNAGYITRAKLLSDHLRGQQEKISRTILSAGRADSAEWDQNWLHTNSRTFMARLIARDSDQTPP
jgi:integrase